MAAEAQLRAHDRLSVRVAGMDDSWTAEAACSAFRGTGWWYSFEPEDIVLALKVCVGCPVREQCLDWAYAVPERFGIWGAVTVEDRKNGRREPSEPPELPPEPDPVLCRWCGGEVPDRRMRLCSDECRAERKRAHQRAAKRKRQDQPVPVQGPRPDCAECGHKVPADAPEAAVVCSLACCGPTHCRCCLGPIPPSRDGRSRYCSTECKHEVSKGRDRERYQRSKQEAVDA